MNVRLACLGKRTALALRQVCRRAPVDALMGPAVMNRTAKPPWVGLGLCSAMWYNHKREIDPPDPTPGPRKNSRGVQFHVDQ
ncbi:hypothetical protein B7486_11980 [cyanobacterium TDX16]|nr:hypothetical protein B7486_11980 [cyanobacterium TDX16]